MSGSLERIEGLARDLVLEKDFFPLEKILPSAAWAGGFFDACLARFEADRLDVHALLAWRGQDPTAIASRGASLRDALRQASPLVGGRIHASFFLVAESASELDSLEAALAPLQPGHFLEKILVARVAVAASAEPVQLRLEGPFKPWPGLDWFKEHFRSPSGHSSEEARLKIEQRESDEASSRRLLARGETWATWGLIALNSACFVAQGILAMQLNARLPGQLPQDGLSYLLRQLFGFGQDASTDQAMRMLGANLGAQEFAKGEAWRLLTCMFLHVNGLHLLLNMASLFSLGTVIERLAGWPKFLLLYVSAGLLGSLCSALNAGNLFSVGASGAIMGLAGALMALKFRRPAGLPQSLADRIFKALSGPVLLTFALGIGLSASGGPLRLDNWAHFGGIFSGFALTYMWPSLLQKSQHKGL